MRDAPRSPLRLRARLDSNRQRFHLRDMDAGHNSEQREALRSYSQGRMTAIDLRRWLGGVTYGEVLRLLGAAHLPLPRASQAGREAEIERARSWLFPRDGH